MWIYRFVDSDIDYKTTIIVVWRWFDETYLSKELGVFFDLLIDDRQRLNCFWMFRLCC